MQIISLNEIQISPNRQRRTFSSEAIADLARSIQANGLLHPIICRRQGADVFLVAGERRLRAMKSLIELEVPIMYEQTAYVDGTLPVTMLTDLSLEKAFEAELEENIIRVDLTWQERAQAMERLHTLRQAQAAERGETQPLRKTVAEVVGDTSNNWDLMAAREDLIVAQHMDDPEVAKASSKKEALKVVEKKVKKAHRAKLAETFDTSKSPHSLLLGDAKEWLRGMGDESIDCLLTDPPYGMDASSFGSNFASEHEYEDSWAYFVDLSKWLSTEAYRILKPNTHAYVFCNFAGFATLQFAFIEAGFKVWPQPMIWSKGNGNAPWVSAGHKKSYECILFASKGMREMTVVKPDVLNYSVVSDRDHAAEKPVELYADLLGRSINPGEIVLDAFAGSGTIFRAADACSCQAIGIEISQDHYNIALTRLTGEA